MDSYYNPKSLCVWLGSSIFSFCHWLRLDMFKDLPSDLILWHYILKFSIIRNQSKTPTQPFSNFSSPLLLTSLIPYSCFCFTFNSVINNSTHSDRVNCQVDGNNFLFSWKIIIPWSLRLPISRSRALCLKVNKQIPFEFKCMV